MWLKRVPSSDEQGTARAEVDALLAHAVERGASDLHLEPMAQGYELRHRIDGVLSTIRALSTEEGGSLVNRLMVAAQLLTYRRGVPQEGRLTVELDGMEAARDKLDLRLSVMPTTCGLRAVLRLPAELIQPRSIEALGLPDAVLAGLERFIGCESGMLILCGPAGSGKTTTTYALLEAIAQRCPGQSILSLEDPVERELAGVTQVEVQPFGELTFEKVLRSMLRQDPQVLAIGEVRDAETAKIAVGAALTGHRLATTLHASAPQRALVRLVEMGVEPYQVASAVAGVVSLRLLRRLSQTGDGYAGRVPVAEYLAVDGAVREALLGRADADTLRAAASSQPGWSTMRDHAARLVAEGVTDLTEVERVLGRGA
ncbi:ATPase, T2SS/T4P/T4SS family [Phycisphaeraceae bacterium D3-23]